jgi:acetate kinase
MEIAPIFSEERHPVILTLNGGSSSLKFALYSGRPFQARLQGKIEKIGQQNAVFRFCRAGHEETKQEVGVQNMPVAVEFLIKWLGKSVGFEQIAAVGHRIVHGMHHKDVTEIDNDLLAELKQISAYDPDHLPAEILLIEKIRELQPGLKQIACFDTAFHQQLPRNAYLFPLPGELEKTGARRYGFHGLSYQYLLEKIGISYGAQVADGRLILAHLGSGCSMAAVKKGQCLDTTMGFTPAGGMMMGTRPGDLDPGLIDYLLKTKKVNPDGLSDLINHRSGLLGVSQISADMGELLEKEFCEPGAADAVSLFCYQAKKWVGAMASVLGGIDGLVFSGGIGEHAPPVRLRICEGLEYLGIHIDNVSNESNDAVISAARGPVKVYVMPTNEEYMIAKLTVQKISGQGAAGL